MDSLEKLHAAEWGRCIISAGGDKNVAQQAVALAALNGLFDLHRATSAKHPMVAALEDRIIAMIDAGLTRFGWTPGPKWHSMKIEEKAAAILEMWDAPKTMAGPPKCRQPQRDVRDIVAELTGYPPGDDPRQAGE